MKFFSQPRRPNEGVLDEVVSTALVLLSADS